MKNLMIKLSLFYLMVFLAFQSSNAQNSYDDILLDAIKINDFPIIKRAVSLGADVNATVNDGEKSMLMLAAYQCDGKILEFLVENGANPDFISWDNKGALDMAIQLGKCHQVATLLKMGAKANTKIDASWISESRSARENLDVLKILYAYGIPISIPADTLENLTRRYQKSEGEEFKQFMVHPFVDFEVLFKNNLSRCIINHLDDSGRNKVFAQNRTLVHLAVLYDDPAVLSYLISLKFTLNDNDSLGRSPLHYAALLQNVTLANILTDAGADVNQQDADGQTPMDIAQRLNNIEIIHLLTLKNAVRGKSNATSSVKINLAPFGGYDYAAISPKNKFILTSTYHTLRIWDVGSGKILKEYILDNSIESAKFSPDEQFIVAKTADRLILIEVATGKEVRTIFDETIWTPIQKTDEDGMTWDTLVEFPQYSDICFSPTGFLLAYIHGNKIKLVDLKNGALINSCFWNPESGMTTVRFSPDGRIIVSGGQDGTTRLWNPETGEKIQFYNQNESEVVSVCVSPDGQQVLTGSNDSIMRLWDILSRKELCRFHLNNNRIDVSFSSDGKYAQSSAHDLQNGSVKIWDLRSKAELKSLKIYPFVNNGFDNKEASVSPNGQFMLNFKKGPAFELWDIFNGTLIRTFAVNNVERINTAIFSRDNNSVLVGSQPDPQFYPATSSENNFNLKLWTLNDLIPFKNFKNSSEPIQAVGFSRDGTNALSASSMGVVKVWDIKSANLSNTIKFDPDGSGLSMRGTHKFLFSPDGKYLLSVAKELCDDLSRLEFDSIYPGDSVKLWEINTGAQNKSIYDDDMECRNKSVCYSSSSNLFATGDGIQKLNIMDINGEGLIKKIRHSPVGIPICFSPDHKIIATCDFMEKMRLLDISSGEIISEILSKGHLGCFSTDGAYFLFDSNNDIVVWDWQQSKEIKRLKGHTELITSLCVSPDGKFVLSASNDRTIKLWNYAAGKEIATLISVDSANWLVTTPSGLFDASPGAMQQMYFTADMEVIGFDALKDRYYEPGLLSILLGFNKKKFRHPQSMPNGE